MGFPGEGPSFSTPRHCSAHWRYPLHFDSLTESSFVSTARSVLTGATPGKGLAAQLVPTASDDHVQNILTRIATAGNSERPVAARLQSHPAKVRDLIRDDSSVTVQASQPGTSGGGDSGNRPPTLRLRRGGDGPTARLGQGAHQVGASVRTPAVSTRQLASGTTSTSPTITRDHSLRSQTVTNLRGAQTEGTPVSRLRTRGFPSGEERWWLEGVHRLPKPEQEHFEDEVSNGRHRTGGSPDSTQRFWHANRPQGLLPYLGASPCTSKILPFPMPYFTQTISVEDCFLRDVRSSQNLHQNSKTFDSNIKIIGHSGTYLHRRSPSPRPGSHSISPRDGHRDGPPSAEGRSSIENFQRATSPIPNVHMPWHCLEHTGNEMLHASETDQGHSAHSQATSLGVDGISHQRGQDERPRTIRGSGGLNHTSHPTGQTPAPFHPAFTIRSSAKIGMDWNSNAFSRSDQRPSVVGRQQPLGPQRKRDRSPDSADSDYGSVGRSNSQRRVRRRVDLQGKSVPDSRLPNESGTEGKVHQRIRIFGDGKHSTSTLTLGHPGQALVGASSHSRRAGQYSGDQIWSSRSESIPQHVQEGRRIPRLAGEAWPGNVVSTFGGRLEYHQRRTVAATVFSHRLDAPSHPLPTGVQHFPSEGQGRPLRKRVELPSPRLLLFPSRSSGPGSGQLSVPVEPTGNGVCVPPSNTNGEGSSESTDGTSTSVDTGSPVVASTTVVADPPFNGVSTTTSSSERILDHGRPDGQPDMAMQVASSRMAFIRKHAASEGVSTEQLQRRWDEKKNKYPKAYDAHFDRFIEWWESTHNDLELSPSNIRPGYLADYLISLKDSGVHCDSIRDASSSVSVACYEATDGRIQQGLQPSVKEVIAGFRRRRPVRRKNDGVYDDVNMLYQEAWLYGPDSALNLGHQKERILLLMAADTASRPSDLSKFFRIFEGSNRMVEYTSWGMKVRFFWPKEVDPGSSRSNSTNYFFSKWINVHNTVPSEISTPACFKNFIAASSGPDYSTEHIPELNLNAQPFVWARKRKGKFLPASVDHIRNVIQAGLTAANMEAMTPRSIRGASPSKIVQLYPDAKQGALNMGRWTNQLTFNNHYQGPVTLTTVAPLPKELQTENLQQVLRWGFKPSPPEGMSAVEYMKGPEHWKGKRIPGFGRIEDFSEGDYSVKLLHGNEIVFYFHYQLMAAIAKSRR
jgi:hypothetical protein